MRLSGRAFSGRAYVPRLVPLLRPAFSQAAGRTPAIVDGFVGELFTLGFALGKLTL